MGSIKKNLTFNILLNVSNVVFPLISAPYIARVLEPDGVGLYQFANTYATYFSQIALLGLPIYGIREVAKKREDKEALSQLVSELVSISFFFTLFVTVIYVLSIFFIPRLSENALILLVSGLVLYCAPLKTDWYFRGIEEFSYITIRSVIIRSLSIVSLFLFVRAKSDLIIYVLISGLSYVVSDGWNFLRMKSTGIKLKIVASKQMSVHYRALIVLFVSSMAISLSSVLDVMMLGFMSDYAQVGYYNSASHISRIIIAVVASLSSVAMPRISYYLKEGRRDEICSLVNKSFSFVAFVSFPTYVILLFVSPTFVPLFFGEEFYGAIIPLQIVGAIIVLIAFSNISGYQVLIGLGKDGLFLRCVIIATILNFLLNLVLIPYQGANGAAIASVISESLLLIMTLILMYKNSNVRLSVQKDIVKSIVGSLLLAPLFLLLKQMNLSGWFFVFLVGIVGAIAYIIIQLVFRNSTMLMIVENVKRKASLFFKA